MQNQQLTDGISRAGCSENAGTDLSTSSGQRHALESVLKFTPQVALMSSQPQEVNQPGACQYQFGPFLLDPPERTLLRGETPIPLPPKAFDTLVYLVENPGRLIPKDDLMKAVWRGTFVEESNLTLNISILRKALGDSVQEQRFIVTVPGRGYRFSAPVRTISPDSQNSNAVVIETHARSEVLIDEATESRALAGPKRLWSAVLASTLLALAVVAGVIAAIRGHRGAIDSVAVLPFVNASGDANEDYLSDGITQSVINNLSPLRNLRVMAVSTMFRYKGKQVDPQVVGHDLGVRAVLSGRLIQRADTIAVQAELIDVSNGAQLWGGQYTRKVADVFALQEDISRVISEKLRLRLTGEEKQRLTKRYTESTEAYQSYLRGRYFWSQWSPEQSLKAIAYFQEAIRHDPRYALAYAGLADTYISRAWFGEDPPREAVPKAKAAALKALEIDEGIAEAHASLGFTAFLYDWDWTGAQKHFERALELNPAYANAHNWYSFYFAALGKTDEALVEARRAVELDPASPGMNQILAIQLTYARRFDEAIQQYRKALEMGYHDAHLGLGNAYAEKGMYREALSEFRQYSAIDRYTPLSISSLGYVHAQLGERKTALRLLDELRALSKRRYVSSASLAMVYIGLGDKDDAFALLDKAYDEHSFSLAFVKVHPAFDPLRSDPRFGGLMRRIRLSG
jgi:DNA-binding winged helix-turn-helix (wHTH) protein/TolB-like protein/Flp pilus assembly protein TadD